MTESELQRKADRLVQADVYVNMSCIISELLRHDPELLDDMSHMYDPTCPACGEVFAEFYGQQDTTDWTVTLKDTYCESCLEEVEPEPEPKEIYEYWSVSNSLARWLDDAGEAVHTDVHGHNIWGRCTTGQAISMDHVIREMVK